MDSTTSALLRLLDQRTAAPALDATRYVPYSAWPDDAAAPDLPETASDEAWLCDVAPGDYQLPGHGPVTVRQLFDPASDRTLLVLRGGLAICYIVDTHQRVELRRTWCHTAVEWIEPGVSDHARRVGRRVRRALHSAAAA